MASATSRLSVPTVVGRRGVVATLPIELWAKEVQALTKSSQVLRETLDGVLARLGQAGAIPALGHRTQVGFVRL